MKKDADFSSVVPAAPSPTFTPGEWTAVCADGNTWSVKATYVPMPDGRRHIAYVAVCNAGAQDNKANANLIASAPDLYAALKRLLADNPIGEDYTFAHAALSKALGQ